jgi:cobaltochelatase CobT
MKFQDVLRNVAEAISEEYGVSIVFRHGQCATDGKKIILPLLPEKAPEEVIRGLRGFLDHEVAHHLFTDFAYVMKAKAYTGPLFDVFNVVEDIRVEKRMARIWKGCGANLAEMEERILKEHTGKYASFPVLQKVLLMTLIIGAHGDDHWFVEKHLDPDVGSFIGVVSDQVARIPTLEDSKGAYELAKEIVQALELELERRKKDREKAEEKKEGKGSSPEAAGDEHVEVDLRRPEEGGVDGEGDEGASEGGSEGSEGRSEDGSPREAPAKSKDGPGDESPDDSMDSLDGPASAPSEEELLEEEVPEEEPRGEESGEEGSEEDKEVDPDDEESFRSEGRDRSKYGVTYVTDAEKDLEKELKGEKSTGFCDKSGLAGTMVLHEIGEHWKYGEYVPLTTEHDIIKVCERQDLDNYLKVKSELGQVVSTLRRTMQRLLLSQMRARWVGGKEEGSINPAALHHVVFGTSKRVYRAKMEGRKLDTAVSILIDESGSMCGKVPKTVEMTALLTEAIAPLAIPLEVAGFSGDVGTGRYAARSSYRSTSVGPDPARWGNLYLEIFKEFDEPLTKTVQGRIGAIDAFSQNYDGESLQWAAMRLLKRKEKKKVLFMLCDGSPCASECDNSKCTAYHAHIVKEIEQHTPIHLIGVGILTDAPSRFFANSIKVDRLELLPELMIRELGRALLQDKRR